MVKKKLQRSGGSLAINIPKMWLDDMGLKEGDDVDLNFVDKKMIIIKKVK